MANEPFTKSSGDRDPRRDPEFQRIFTGYVDELNLNAFVDPDQILEDHPELGPAIVEDLETYVQLRPEDDAGSEPLGQLGDYTLRRQIGRGGMGVVYEAWENSMDRTVALKVLPSAVAADSRATTRFLREAQTAGKLNHPNVVGVYSTGVKEGTPWYAMEYVEGETLAQVLARIKDAEPETETPFGSKDEVAYFHNMAKAFADVADGLQHAHSKGVTHRDIKPSNLILDSDGRLRILDFGLARLEGQESLTLSGDLVGTPLYMSPEQARRKKIRVDHRTDVYSLGATLYEALCARPLFQGKDYADTLSQIIERDPVEPRKVNLRVPKDLETVVLKCLRKDAGDRYGTAEALGQDLRRFVRGDAVEARPLPGWERLRTRLRRYGFPVGVIAGFLPLVAIALWLGYEREQLEYENRLGRYESSVGEVLRFIYAHRTLTPVALEDRSNLDAKASPPRPWTRKELRNLSGFEDTSRLESAMENLRAIARDLPERPDARYHLARALLSLGNVNQARAECARVIRFAGDFVPASALLREISSERSGVAERSSVTVEHWPADSWQAPWLNAYRYAREQDPSRRFQQRRELADAYERMLELNRGSDRRGEPYIGFFVEAHIGRGLVLLDLGDPLGALGHFWAAADRFPGIELEFFKAKAYYLAGEPERAEETFLEIHGKDEARRNGTALWIASVYDSLRDWQKGLDWVDRLDDSFPITERLRSHFLYRSGRLNEAITEAEAAIARNEDDVLAHFILATALAEQLSSMREAQRQRGLSHFLSITGRLARMAPDSERTQRLLEAAEAVAKRANRPRSRRGSMTRSSRVQTLPAAGALSVSVAGLSQGQQGFFTGARRLAWPLNTTAHEFAPVIAADGLSLYFTASSHNRAGHGREDIWVATRSSREEDFSEVVNFQDLAAPGVRLNSPRNDGGGWPTQGHRVVYFKSAADGNVDIYRAMRAAPSGLFTRVERLGNNVNSDRIESHPSLTADGLLLFFYRRDTGQSEADVYMATRTSTSEEFEEAVALDEINTGFSEMFPRISADGLMLFFSDWWDVDPRPGGRGWTDLWAASRSSRDGPFGAVTNLNDVWPGTDINTTSFQAAPVVSPHWPAPGSEIYFTSGNLPDGNGDQMEIWVATWVTRPGPAPKFSPLRPQRGRRNRR